MSQKKSDILSDKGKSTANVPSPSPIGKKLIQARLPFKTLATSPKVVIDSPGSGEGRKRKLSSQTDDDNRSAKLSKTSTTTKENIKTDEPTVLETIDLLENSSDSLNEVVMIGDEKVINSDIVTPKSDKKSIKSKNSEDKDEEFLRRRCSRKDDFEKPAKVLIKIPSSKKKKSNKQPGKVKLMLKVDEDENSDDDDIIPIDSGEESLTSFDGKVASNAIDASSSDKTEEKLDSLLDKDEKSFSNSKSVKESIPDDVEKDLSLSQGNQEKESGSTLACETATKLDEASVIKSADVATESNAQNSNDTNISSTPNDGNLVASTTADDVIAECVAQNSNDTSISITSTKDSDDDNLEKSVVEKVEAKTGIDSEACNTPTRKPDNGTFTPKQLQRKLESEKKRLEKQKAKDEREKKLQEAKEERERKLQEEKELRQKEREEKERQRKKERDDKEEQKRKEREDKEEQRRKEKEEREKKKQAEIDAKNEEKRQKEEEKRLKEEEKTAKEEAEMKKKRKEAEAFTKFFAKKKHKSIKSDKMDVDDTESKLIFMPFRVKDDMRLAPIVRRKLSPTRKTALENLVLNCASECSEKDLYIQSLRSGFQASEKQGRTWPNEDPNDDLMIIDDLEGATAIEETSSIQKYRAKFLKFSENRRPPYYGTWQKKSSLITPRRPFSTDSKFFDYEIDSDDEWEDEEPGESLHGSDDEKDKESDDDYDIDNEFFVPHGHLSDEEIANEDEIDDDNSPDTQKAKLKIMQKVFSDEMKKKTEKIKPRLIGFIWQNKDGSQPHGCPNVIWDMLQIRSMIFHGPNVVFPKTPCVIEKYELADDASDPKKNSAMKKRAKVTDDVVVDLIRLIHGNTNNSAFLMREFHAFIADKNKDNENFKEFSLASIRSKIKELAEWKPCPEEGPLLNKYCWYVAPEHRKHHNIEQLSIVNDWKYILSPKTKTTLKVKDNEKVKNITEASDEISSNKTSKSKLGNIAKFAKVLSDDDKKKKFLLSIQEPLVISSPIAKPQANPTTPGRKRVKLLMSGPRGQEVSAEIKNPLISQYLSSISSNKKSTDDDEPICID